MQRHFHTFTGLSLLAVAAIYLALPQTINAQQELDLDIQANWHETFPAFPNGYIPKQDSDLFSHRNPMISNDLAVDFDGNAYAIMPVLKGPKTNRTREFVLVKYDVIGRQLWRKELGEFGDQEQILQLTVGPKGNLYTVGNKIWKGKKAVSTSQGFVVCFSPAGKQRWSYITNNRGHGTDAQFSAIVADKDSVTAVGYAKGRLVRSARDQPSFDLLLTRLSPTGKHLWTRQYQGAVDERRIGAFGIARTPKGAICIAANYHFFPPPQDGKRPVSNVGLTIAIDQRGKNLWANTIGDDLDINDHIPDHEHTSGSRSVASDPEGNLYVTGYLNEHSLLTKLSPKGEVIWTRLLNVAKPIKSKRFTPNRVRVGPEGNVWIAGPYDWRPTMFCFSAEGELLSTKIYSKDRLYNVGDFDFVPGTTQAIIWGKYDPTLANKDPQNYGPQYFMANIDLETPEAGDE